MKRGEPCFGECERRERELATPPNLHRCAVPLLPEEGGGSNLPPSAGRGRARRAGVSRGFASEADLRPGRVGEESGNLQRRLTSTAGAVPLLPEEGG